MVPFGRVVTDQLWDSDDTDFCMRSLGDELSGCSNGVKTRVFNWRISSVNLKFSGRSSLAAIITIPTFTDDPVVMEKPHIFFTFTRYIWKKKNGRIS